MKNFNFETVDDVQNQLNENQYIADKSLSTSLFLSLKMKRPIFLEGEPGVGKTEIAKVLAKIRETKLIRLQCYEGLDVHNAIYEWNYSMQILHIKMMELEGKSNRNIIKDEIFGPKFLIKRPLYKAIDFKGLYPPVLLIDELDRADEEFEAFLLEILSDYQITIPEIGTIRASKPPIVVITSNRTREVHDALKRRCLYHWIGYPSAKQEFEIIKRRIPEVNDMLGKQIIAFVQNLRKRELYKLPGVAETLDWTDALIKLGTTELSKEITKDTLGTLLKYQDDIESMDNETSKGLIKKAFSEANSI